MQTFDLTIPPEKLTLAKSSAKEAGGRLLVDDERSNGHVYMGVSLPATLRNYAVVPLPTPTEPLYWSLAVPFDLKDQAQLHGARWDSPNKCYYYVGTTLPAGLEPYRALPFSWESVAQRNQRKEKPDKLAPKGDPIIPRRHQTEAAKHIVEAAKNNYPGFLLADEVGLGKTISAWLAIQEVATLLKCTNILVVAPLSVLAHWRLTIERMGSTIPDVLVINYDKLAKLFELPTGVKVKTKKGLAKRAEASQVDLIIFDESHKLKNPTTARTKLAAKLTANVHFCLYLSATAGQNPLELSYLAALIAKSTGASAKSMKDFEQWCLNNGLGLQRGAFGKWEWSGLQEDCRRLHTILYGGKSPAGLRRRPSDIQGWPELNRILLPQELSPEAKLLYNSSWEAFRLSMLGKNKVVATVKDAGVKAKKGSINALVEALRFRQKSSELRISQTAAMALDLLEEGIKPAISCAFKLSAQSLKDIFDAKKIRCAFIHGGLSAQLREEERLRFQQGQADIIIFTVEEGISLHQGEYAVDEMPRALLIHDLRWSAIQMAQIEGRTHRDGKFSQAYWLAGENTVEMAIAERVAKKTVGMKSLSGDEDVSIDHEIMEVLLKFNGVAT